MYVVVGGGASDEFLEGSHPCVDSGDFAHRRVSSEKKKKKSQFFADVGTLRGLILPKRCSFMKRQADGRTKMKISVALILLVVLLAVFTGKRQT